MGEATTLLGLQWQVVAPGLPQRVEQVPLLLVELELRQARRVPHGVCDDSLSVSSTKSRSLRGCSRSTVSNAVLQVSLTQCKVSCCCLAKAALE